MTDREGSGTGQLRDAVAHLLRARDLELEHELVLDSDGDGRTMPFSDRYACTCGATIGEWTQADPECTGRPHEADMLLAWHEHAERSGHPRGITAADP